MRVAAAIAVLALIIVALLPVRLTATPLPIIPLDEGTEWTYSAKVSWTVVNSNHVRSDSIQWKARVVKTFTSPAVTAAVISGFPDDLAWYEPGTKPTYVVLIETESGLSATFQNRGSESEAEKLAQKALAGDQVGEQLLRFPVKEGDCVNADDDSPKRTDGMYCWRVLGRVHDARGEAWELMYQTNPDTLVFRMVPGVGVTSYTYDHHGTVASADARLVEFHTPPHR
jgi:hypothetical protein